MGRVIESINECGYRVAINPDQIIDFHPIKDPEGSHRPMVLVSLRGGFLGLSRHMFLRESFDDFKSKVVSA